MEYQTKLNEKYTSVLHCISNFEGTSYKNAQDTATSSFVYCCFTSADIIFTTFQNFIQHYEEDFCHKFSLFNGFVVGRPL